LLCSRHATHPALLPFPTRRSSDLHPSSGLLAEGASRPAHRGQIQRDIGWLAGRGRLLTHEVNPPVAHQQEGGNARRRRVVCRARDRKSTRLNSSHVSISYAVFCLK